MVKRKSAMAGMGRKHRHQMAQVGANIFTDIYDKVVKPVYEKVLRPAHDVIKKTGAVSAISGLIPHPAAQAISKGARALGYGKRRRHRGGAKKSSHLKL